LGELPKHQFSCQGKRPGPGKASPKVIRGREGKESAPGSERLKREEKKAVLIARKEEARRTVGGKRKVALGLVTTYLSRGVDKRKGSSRMPKKGRKGTGCKTYRG